MLDLSLHQATIVQNVKLALEEDLGNGDITAQLIPADTLSKARVISRDAAVIAGSAWVNQVLAMVDSQVKVNWEVNV